MEQDRGKSSQRSWPCFPQWPLPGKVLATAVILMMALGLGGAAAQVIVHDVIPTFWNGNGHQTGDMDTSDETMRERGDLFAGETSAKAKKAPFYKADSFIFALKFTHIHIFGMSLIFILMGIIVCFLDTGEKIRVWLIILPFVGVIMDLLAVWLKVYVSPSFFWLHIPGGGLFGTVFAIDASLALWQMWVVR